MKKTLLIAPSNAVFYTKTFLLNFFFWIGVLTLGTFQKAQAQCPGPYQVFEGVPANFAAMTGWNTSGGIDVIIDNGGAGFNRSGWYSLANFGGPGEYVDTPVIATPLTFAFYASDVAGAGGNYDVQINDGTNGWQSLSIAGNRTNYGVSSFVLPAMSGPGVWDLVSFTFGNAAQPGYSNSNVQFRIIDNSGGMAFDDISWTSKIAADNTIIIPVLGTSPTNCTQSMTTGQQLTFYDNGGASDAYAGYQENTVTFTAINPADKIKITFNSFFATSPFEFYVHDGATTASPAFPQVNGYSGSSNPSPVTYISTGSSLTIYYYSDDFSLSDPGFNITVLCESGSTCFTPSNPLTGSVTTTTANVSWTAASGTPPGYDIFYSTNSAATPGAPQFTNVTSPFNITGLTGGTTYYYWVRSNCGATQSAWVGPSAAFTTICTPVGVPYIENFNGQATNAIPTCTYTDSPANWLVNLTNGNLYCAVGATNFYTKPVTLTGGTEYRLTYDFSAALGTANFNVYYGTTNTTPTTGTINTLLFSHIGAGSIASNIINFTPGSSGTYYIRFQLASTSNAPNTQFNLDNIVLVEETCKPPTAVTASGVTASAANISWTAPAIAPSNGYQYYINTTNSTPSYSVTVTGATAAGVTTAALSGLTASTTFYVWVRSNCGGFFSGWSLVTSFTTSAGALPVLISQGGSVTQCDYSFFDSGGAAGNYVDNESYQITLYPGVVGTKVKVVFSSFSTENNYDGLMIYNGNSTGAPLISSGLGAGFNAATCPAGSFRGSTSPGTVISTAADGSLTFVYRTDFSIVSSGWAAFVSCVISPTITSFTPANNNCGTANTVVTITGTNFTGVNSVRFNGIAAAFTVVNSTTITATVPASATSGLITVSTPTATGVSATSFIVQAPPPVTTGVTVCPGGSGTISSSTVCNGFVNSGTSLSGNLTAGVDATAPRPTPPGGNSTTCSFTSGAVRNYVAIQFQVSISGTYTFGGASGFDLMGYITTGSFTPGSCATGTYIVGDDDSNGGLQPRLTITLTAGVTYTLYTTTWSTITGNVTGPFNWTITPPVGGQIMLQGNPSIQWFTAASGGTAIGSGSPFNPVGVAGSGLANTSTPGTWTYYAECSSNPGCRTATTFVIGGAVGGTASANQSICSGAFADLTLTGNTGTVVKWQYASDAAFTVGVTDIAASASTTLTSAQIGSFSGTRYYRAEVTQGGCANVYSTVVTLSNSKTVWNGSAWSSGAPTATVGAEFQGNFTSSVNASPTGNISACSVTITSGTVIFDIGTLTVQNQVTVSGGSLTFEDDASLYQVNNVANAVGVYSGGNTGSITSKRDSAPMFRYDYTYWSTPVNPQTLLAVSPTSPTSLAYEYDGATSTWVYFNPSGNMIPGKGYIFRAPIGFNLSPGTPLVHTASFVGVPNNGTISVPIFGGANEMNLLGNPYPSALDANDFINGNPNVNGTLYFWTHNTQSTAPYQYNQSDYALYNLGGGVAAGTTGAGNNSVPTRYIGSGQGFFVKGLTSGPAVFNNSMREPGNNTQFYRNVSEQQNANELEKHRYWLDITSASGAFKQLMVGYIQTATNEIDRLFDGEMVDAGNAISLYTKVNDVKLSIQGRALPFEVNDTIPLGFKSTEASTYTITLSAFDGLFMNQTVYLEDTLLGVIHNLNEAPYTFTTEAGSFDQRFILRYTTEALGVTNPIFNENTVVVYRNETGLHINSGAVNMKNVTIFDIRGRQIATQKQIGTTHAVFTTLPTTQQVLLVKIESENGITVTKKVVY
ncbi:fibronectin type III domain-containing protein [Flavobacterium sedimenticola]|uniref:T9SS sorting signal type C domain-containing protein n=1 Tax=Flavobacterium sedimenticola TaxID=3043286 RepID=A0ABT6XP98_9FLAO|nr:T9SS sorting signal type C domain-containing protein [Flavobacterium sedimenticola]MDI9256667.1 T9SS sorting signal type C domain-containing protein [Flavobacterium sedimenticola]